LYPKLEVDCTKNLSVNRYSLSPADHGSGEEEETEIAGLGFLEADQDFAEAIEPGVGSLYDPAAGPMSRVMQLFV
jgi:hypothetical protein